jgi:hypothetical protein
MAEIEALVSHRQVGALRIGIDREWRRPREQVVSFIRSADAVDRFMASHEFPQYHPKREEVAQD